MREDHITAKPDYRVDQIKRYMRRHGGAAFVNPYDGSESYWKWDEWGNVGHCSRESIVREFNEARKRGMNQ